MIRAEEIAVVMGGRSVIRRQIRSLSDLDRVIDEGIPREVLDHVLSTLFGAAGIDCFPVDVVDSVKDS